MQDPFNYDVFLSFAGSDKEFVKPIWQEMSRNGLRVFWSDENLKENIGQSFFSVIQDALIHSKHLVLLCSEHSMKSKWVKVEYETFFNECYIPSNGKRRLVVFSGENFDKSIIPPLLKHIQICSSVKRAISILGGINIQKLIDENNMLKQHLESTNDQIEKLTKDKKTLQDQLDTYRNKPIETTKELATKIIVAKPGNKLIKIPGGDFMMGSPEKEEGRKEREGPLHEVKLSDFHMQKYPVTNKEYEIFLKENPDIKEPEHWANPKFSHPDQPVVEVSWEDAQKYAEWSELRLPTEAEWEYACRAGNSTRYYTGDSENEFYREAGWYSKNSGGQTHQVGLKYPNSFGLYDMHGNVWEWVEDYWHDNYKGAPDNGIVWVDNPSDSFRVLRGGCWVSGDMNCRSAFRGKALPNSRNLYFGFRLAR